MSDSPPESQGATPGFIEVLRRETIGPALAQLQSIRRRPNHFITWLIGIAGMGLAGFWLPLFYVAVRVNEPEGAIGKAVEGQLFAGTLASFCVALLAEGIVTLHFLKKAGSTTAAKGLLAIAVSVSVILVLLLIAVMGMESAARASGDGNHVYPWIHVTLALVSIAMAAFLFCIRLSEWDSEEETAEEAKKKQDEDVKALGDQANRKSNEGGVAL